MSRALDLVFEGLGILLGAGILWLVFHRPWER